VLRLTTAAILLVSGCTAAPPTPVPTASPPPTATPSIAPPDSGPVDAVTADFLSAQAAGPQAKLLFVTCVTGGNDAIQFGQMLTSLAELALVSSGVHEDEFWSAFGVTLGQFSAVERARVEEAATVDVAMTVTITPDLATLRRLMAASLAQRGQPTADPAIEALLERLAGFQSTNQAVDNDVTVQRADGVWHACDLPGRAGDYDRKRG
jgi:hypothetical protein